MTYSEKSPNKRILVVDDETDVLDFLKIYLESLNWEVVTASSTTSAFDHLDKQHFFLVLTDIAMPEMDGYEFVTKAKEKHVGSEMALMTGFGYNPNHTLVKINQISRHVCLFKPFNRAKLAETVQKAFDSYHQNLTA